ncbi:MAG: hypothetical protein GXP46_03635 [Deferribacteres bacterium]|nr:hypothetical protein [Deferribacteres bacterium]
MRRSTARESPDQFWRAYDNEYESLKKQFSDPKDIDKRELQDRVLARMINTRVLLIAARRAGITVTEKELQEAIKNQPFFQRDGAFDPDLYKRKLKFNRLTPQAYESSVRNDMLITKMTRLITETVELSPDELKIIDSIKGGNKDQLSEVFRATKGSQMINAYIAAIKRQLDIKVNRDLIS